MGIVDPSIQCSRRVAAYYHLSHNLRVAFEKETRMSLLASALMGWAGYVLTAGCPTIPDMTPILYAEVPDDLGDDIAVEIEIIAIPRTAPRGTYEARVERVIKGEGIGKRIRFRSDWMSSGDAFPGLGARGILVGKIEQRDHGELLMTIRRARVGDAAKKN